MPRLETTCYGCNEAYCSRCGAGVETYEENVHYCSGCEEAICCECGVNASLPFGVGNHHPDDHLEENEDEDGRSW